MYNWVQIGSSKDLSPALRYVITWTNAYLLQIECRCKYHFDQRMFQNLFIWIYGPYWVAFSIGENCGIEFATYHSLTVANSVISSVIAFETM